jgi:cytidylate kinase
VVTGAPGAGKSSVVEKLTTLLEIEGVEFGALESEQLGWGSPWLAHEHVIRQLRAVVDLQRQAGRTTFVIAATTETDAELAAVIDAVGADHVATVLLTASPETVAERIGDREPDSWPGKRSLIAHARKLARSMPSLARLDVVVSTERRGADEVTRELRAALRDLGVLP